MEQGQILKILILKDKAETLMRAIRLCLQKVEEMPIPETELLLENPVELPQLS